MTSAGFKVSGILLAAGIGQRFGSDKRLYPLQNGEAMAVSVAKKLLSVCDEVIAVVRSEQDPVLPFLAGLGVLCVPCARASEGMGYSLATGVAEAQAANSNAILVALADMPYVKFETYQLLVSAIHDGAGIVVPVFNGKRGNPVGFSANWFSALMECKGDEGARAILNVNQDCVLGISVADSGIHQDIDRPEDVTRQS